MAKPVFCEFGGMYQLRLNSAEEIRYIGSLEKARWSATSAPQSSSIAIRSLTYL